VSPGAGTHRLNFHNHKAYGLDFGNHGGTKKDSVLYLTRQEEAMIKGEYGEASRLAMEILVKVGEACGAERMVEVARCHAMTAMAPDIHEARIDLLEKFASLGAHYSVPTTLDPASLDLERQREFRAPKSYCAKATKLLRLNDKLGAIPNYSCAPYQQGLAPSFGEFVSLTESSYIVFSNSVIGARANRETQGIVVPASITGRVPLYGLRIKENRLGGVLVKLNGLSHDSLDTSDYATIGYYIGAKLGHEIPVIDGFKRSLTTDQLKVLGASAACKGCVAMFHIVGITPEANTREEAFAGRKPRDTLEIDRDEIRRTRGEISTVSGGKIDAILVGCPHYSISEIKKLAVLLQRKRIDKRVKFFLYTSQEAKSLADRMGLTKAVESAGVYVSVGTCMTLSPMKYWGFETIMTDSPKTAYTSPVDMKVDVVFASIEECVKAAIRGEA
jgi:hypothetical protein